MCLRLTSIGEPDCRSFDVLGPSLCIGKESESIIERGHGLELFFHLGQVQMSTIAWHKVAERRLVMIVNRRQGALQFGGLY